MARNGVGDGRHVATEVTDAERVLVTLFVGVTDGVCVGVEEMDRVVLGVVEGERVFEPE